MEKREKKVRNIKKPGMQIKASSLLFALLALVLTVIVFGVLLFVQDYVKEDITYKAVVVAKTDIPENEIITESNAVSYFEMKNMNILDTMDGSLISVDEILGEQTKVFMYAGEIVTAKDFKSNDFSYDSFENPVEISINVGEVASADGGKIRAGDTVNIAMMFDREQLGMDNSLQSVAYSGSLFTNSFNIEEDSLFADEESENENEDESLTEEIEEESGFFTESLSPIDDKVVELTDEDMNSGDKNDYVFNYYAEYILENIYVTKALDGSGIEISPTDTESAASILVFVIEKDQELAVNNALANCVNIRVSKSISKSENSDATVILDDSNIETESSETVEQTTENETDDVQIENEDVVLDTENKKDTVVETE